jgi:hypothetical protein
MEGAAALCPQVPTAGGKHAVKPPQFINIILEGLVKKYSLHLFVQVDLY